MQVTNVCKGCGKPNHKEWYLWKSPEGKMVKTCRECRDAGNSGVSMSRYHKAKARVEADRKRNNDRVVSLLRSGLLPRPPGS